MRLRLLGCALILLLACGGEPAEPEGPLTCEEGDLALSGEFGRRFAGAECASHADCTTVTLEPHCPADGARYTWCPTAVRVSDVDRIRSELTGVLADVCPRIPADCRGGALCGGTEAPVCVDGRCRLADPIAQCIDDCNACGVLSTCEGHCPARHECILAADTCDAIVTCVSGPPPDAG